MPYHKIVQMDDEEMDEKLFDLFPFEVEAELP